MRRFALSNLLVLLALAALPRLVGASVGVSNCQAGQFDCKDPSPSACTPVEGQAPTGTVPEPGEAGETICRFVQTTGGVRVELAFPLGGPKRCEFSQEAGGEIINQPCYRNAGSVRHSTELQIQPWDLNRSGCEMTAQIAGWGIASCTLIYSDAGLELSQSDGFRTYISSNTIIHPVEFQGANWYAWFYVDTDLLEAPIPQIEIERIGPRQFDFDASPSYSPNPYATIDEWFWLINGSSIGLGNDEVVSRTFPAGEHEITLGVRDDKGKLSEEPAVVNVRVELDTIYSDVDVFDLSGVPLIGENGLDYVFEVGEEFTVNAGVRADPYNAEEVDVQSWDALTFNPSDALEIVATPSGGVPQGFSLSPSAREELVYTVRALKRGKIQLKSQATGVDSKDEPAGAEPAFLDVHVQHAVLKVGVEIEDPAVKLKEVDGEPVPEDRTVTITIENVLDTPVDDVAISDFDLIVEPFPETVPGSLTVKSGPTDPAGPNPDAGDIGTIPAKGTVVRTYVLEASDDGFYTVRAKVSATNPVDGLPFEERDDALIKITGDLILYFESSKSGTDDFLGNGGDWVDGGGSWQIRGLVENRSEDKNLLVLLQPRLIGNAFYAQPIPDGTTPPDSACTLGLVRVLAPQEELRFDAPVRTLDTGGTRGTVIFEPKGFILEDDDTRTPLDPGKEVYYKAGSTRHVVSVSTRDEPPPEATVDELIGNFAEGTVQGLGVFAEGIVGIAGLAVTAIGKGLQVWEWPNMFRAVNDKLAAYLIEIREGLPEAERVAFDLSLTSALVSALDVSFDRASDLVNQSVEARFTELTTAWETGDSRAVARWWGELAGENPDLALQALVGGYAVCKMARNGAQTVRSGLLGKKASQAATLESRVAQGARGLKSGDALEYAAHRAGIFGIDKVTDRLLRELAEKWNIVIAVRRRGVGVIEKLKTGRFAFKSGAIKAKNVSPIDVDWLGFPGDKLDEVLIKQPPPWDEVRNALRNEHPELISEVRERWQTRWEEWYGKGADFDGRGGDLANSERAKWISYQNNGMPYSTKTVDGIVDNFDKGFSLPADDPLKDLRPFRTRFAKTGDGRPALIAQVDDPAKGWLGMTGDVDPLAFLKPDGTILPPETRLALYKAMRHLGFQHPESLTWTNAKGRARYLEEFSVNNPASEAMAMYRPDGTVIASRFDPGKSWINPKNFRNAAQMYFRAATNHVRSTEPTPVDMSALEDVAKGQQLTYISPGTWAIVNPNCNGGLSVWSEGGPVDTTFSCSASPQYSNDPDAIVLRQVELGKLERWTPAGGWRDYDPEGPEFIMLPQTALSDDVPAGSTVLEIYELGALGLDPVSQEWFSEGQVVVINPGGENEEEATIDSFGSIVLAAPLAFDHEAGEMITVKPAVAIGVTTTLPTTTTTMIEIGTSPQTPTVSGLVGSTDSPLTHFTLDATAFEDAEQSNPTAMDVFIEGPLDDGAIGVVYDRRHQAVKPGQLVLPHALLDPDTEYSISIRYVDSDGLVSGFSTPIAFTTVAVDPNDTNADGVEDEAEVSGETDVNGNGTPDSEDFGSIVAFLSADGDEIGLGAFSGEFNRVTTMTQVEVFMENTSDIPAVELPYGMTAFRVEGLTPGASVTVGHLYPDGLGTADQFVQFDPALGMVDLTEATAFFYEASAFSGPFAGVTYVDGGTGDLDGVANGRIVDPSGLAQGYLGPGVCSAPVSRSEDRPVASDCLYILRTAVGANSCAPTCICAPTGELPVTATDALLCLRSAVGSSGLELDCRCVP